ncbi:ABC transporter ATP-binding protein [Herbiconiux sp. L3-i23]|uniref:dipeptide ABC transporter ATP-binding protein n=1 Tax=Herbiconiux sp. L3-i23 TaxID=2905871 RepID=UPI002052258D|nr:ABC transporter ATP-binding protein [Herbiconiux sp. L3-i23]BDI23516.1 ABC transporter ATP-binding protein [Herbiconiux sp. L3-i23]
MSNALLQVRDLRVQYETGATTNLAVRGVDFDVPAGSVVAIVGESGSGKSTISQSLIRQVAEGGRIVGGSVVFDGRDLVQLPESALRKIRGAQIGFVPQDPSSSLNPLVRVGEQIAEALRLHKGMKRAAAAKRAVEILDEVGIPDAEIRAGQYPHELSGGMRQRVLIGIAWSCEPRLVIADEPTSALDVTVQRHVLDRLEGLAREHGTSVLLVTHDLAVAADRADRILVMQRGEIVEQGTVAEVLGNPQHAYTRELVAAAPGLTSGRLQPQDVTVHDPAARRALTLAFTERDDSGKPADILVIENLAKTFSVRGGLGSKNAIAAVDDVSFRVRRGSTFSIVGESGSGKTTTARIAARIVDADAGTIRFDGDDITTLRGEGLRQLRRKIQVVYQNPFGSLDPMMTVERIVAEPLAAFRIGSRAERSETVRAVLDAVRLAPELAGRRPRQLSGGQRQRVAIARALTLGPELLVLDEPVSALDVSVQEQILQLLVDLQKEFALSYLFISHDLGVIRQISDDIAVMRFGRLVESGTAAEVMASPREEYTRELLAAIPGSRAV